jgi:hypothetical protein
MNRNRTDEKGREKGGFSRPFSPGTDWIIAMSDHLRR